MKVMSRLVKNDCGATDSLRRCLNFTEKVFWQFRPFPVMSKMENRSAN